MKYQSESIYHSGFLEIKPPYTVHIYEHDKRDVLVKSQTFWFLENARKYAKSRSMAWSEESVLQHDWFVLGRNGMPVDMGSTAKEVQVLFRHVPLINR